MKKNSIAASPIDIPVMGRMREARIAWKIGQKTGNGLWFPVAHSHELMTVASLACERYGGGTHWVEERDA